MNDRVGSLIAQRRRWAGMSLAQLAEGIASKSMLSMIESGKRTASPELLEKIVSRLGISDEDLANASTMDSLYSAQSRLLQAQILFAEGRTNDALPVFEDCVALFERERMHLEIANSALGVARCCESLGRFSDAFEWCEKALGAARLTTNVELVLEIRVGMAMMLREQGDVGAALDILKACRRELPEELQSSAVGAKLTAVTILSLVERGDFVTAHRLAQSALSALDADEQPLARARVLWNASLAAEANQDSQSAILLAQEALNLLQRLGERAAIPRLRLCIAWLYSRMTPPGATDAIEQLTRAELELGVDGPTAELATMHEEFARVLLLKSQLPDARRRIDKAVTIRRELKAPASLAKSLLISAQVCAAEGNVAGVAASIEQAKNLLAGLDGSRATSLVWRELGDSLARHGLHEQANQCFQFALTDAGISGSFGLDETADTETGGAPSNRQAML